MLKEPTKRRLIFKMVIMTNETEKIVVPKVWGTEEWVVNTPDYCGKILNLNEGFRCSMHYHKRKDETFYIVDGEVLLEYEMTKRIMVPGESQRILREGRHRFTGLQNSRLIEFSTHHEESDSYREGEQLSGAVNLNELIDNLREEGLLR